MVALRPVAATGEVAAHIQKRNVEAANLTPVIDQAGRVVVTHVHPTATRAGHEVRSLHHKRSLLRWEQGQMHGPQAVRGDLFGEVRPHGVVKDQPGPASRAYGNDVPPFPSHPADLSNLASQIQ